MISSPSNRPTSETLLNSPRFFLHSIDTFSSQLIFLETTRETLSALPFVDGRMPLSPTERRYSVEIQEALEWQPADTHLDQSDRLIFHFSFCGSTLLARACEARNRTLAIKEPRALLDLAAIKAGRLSYYKDWELWSKLVKLTLGQLRKPWSVGEVPIIKLSNWSNTLLVDLLQHGQDPRTVLLSIDLRNFLVAVLRGGRERIAYICRLVYHLQAEDRQLRHLINEAASPGIDPMEGAIKLAVLAHCVQGRIFDRAIRTSTARTAYRLSYEELMRRPADVIGEVSHALNLNLANQDTGLLFDRAATRHAKNPDIIFDHDQLRDGNRWVEKKYGRLIDRAVDWHRSRIKPGAPLPGQNSINGGVLSMQPAMEGLGRGPKNMSLEPRQTAKKALK